VEEEERRTEKIRRGMQATASWRGAKKAKKVAVLRCRLKACRSLYCRSIDLLRVYEFTTS
jgi:hypothetical protein